MKKLFPIFLLIFLLPVLASAQNGYFIWKHGNLNSTLPPELASAQYGYFVTDSTRMDTIILFDGGDVSMHSTAKYGILMNILFIHLMKLKNMDLVMDVFTYPAKSNLRTQLKESF